MKTITKHCLTLLILLLAFNVCKADSLPASNLEQIKKLKQSNQSNTPLLKSWIIDFDQHDIGNYTEKQLMSDWRNPKWVMGRNLLSIIDGKQAYSGKSLKLTYLKGKSSCKSRNHCILWRADLDEKLTKLYYGFRFKLSDDFNFIKGGKLPGISGGKGNTGGRIPNGRDGWSVRMMWNDEGKPVQYAYHPDQKGKYGDALFWDKEGQGQLERGKWHTVQTMVQLNTPKKKDGRIVTWFNGKKVLVKEGLRFRDINGLEIDRFLFVSFFGGHGPEWAPLKDETAYIDDIRIAQTAPFYVDE